MCAVPPNVEGADLVAQVPLAVSSSGQVACARNKVGDCLEVGGVVVLLIACLVPLRINGCLPGLLFQSMSDCIILRFISQNDC